MTARTLEVVQQIVEQGGEADDVLRAAVAALVEEPGIDWAGIAFVEDGELRLGPAAGVADDARRRRAPILFQGAPVAELWVDGEIEQQDLEQIATVVAPYALIGWDTGGEAWVRRRVPRSRDASPVRGRVPRSRDCIPQTCDYKEIGERGREPRARPRTGARQ